MSVNIGVVGATGQVGVARQVPAEVARRWPCSRGSSSGCVPQRSSVGMLASCCQRHRLKVVRHSPACGVNARSATAASVPATSSAANATPARNMRIFFTTPPPR